MPKVLLVDDNAKYLKDALPFYGYEVKTASNGVEALKILFLNNTDFDIMLLDFMMPEMDGWRVLTAVRSHESTKNLPIIMLTAVNEDQKMISCLKNGADDYIVKPFILPNLLARMEAVLRRAQRMSEPTVNVSELPLTLREKEVLKLIAKGVSNHDIAEKLYLSEVTVKSHISNIFKKLDVKNRTQAVLVATQNTAKN